jgi:uncharacterized protein YigA (DUF484 family)
MTQAIDAHAVALYLEDHPQFFDQHPDLIAGLKLTTALGGRTVSLHERQVEVLREKVRQLELKLGNQGHVARDNQAIMEKFHQWVLRLLSADDGGEPNFLLASVRDCFDVPAASLRLWSGANNDDIWRRPEHGQTSTLVPTAALQEESPACNGLRMPDRCNQLLC